LKKSVSSWIPPFAIREVLRVGKDEVIIVVFFALESLPTSSSIDGLVGGGLLAYSVAMEFKAGEVQEG
jgi:hypothetical protein